jgi:hypothetical protein
MSLKVMAVLTKAWNSAVFWFFAGWLIIPLPMLFAMGMIAISCPDPSPNECGAGWGWFGVLGMLFTAPAGAIGSITAAILIIVKWVNKLKNESKPE